MTLSVFKQSKCRVPVTGFGRLFEMITEEEADPDALTTVNLIFITDSRIRTLNRKFRAVDRATDVLAFNIDPPDLSGGILGEVYISSDRVGIQARSYGCGLWDEYLRLFCHGLLHLLGYDHVRKSDADLMQHRQQYFLDRLKENGR